MLHETFKMFKMNTCMMIKVLPSALSLRSSTTSFPSSNFQPTILGRATHGVGIAAATK